MKYIYGPVSSWRLGKSLGIDLISGDKSCSFDCIYCQLGKTITYVTERQIFAPTAQVLQEFDSLPKLNIDYVTFSGCGEPTLAANLGEVISEIKKRTKTRIAVLTNSSLMRDPEVRKELGLADLISAKLDAPDEKIFKIINRPVKALSFQDIIEGIKEFNKEFPGRLALQIMFVPENKDSASKLADLAKEIKPAEVHINTPLRPSATKPLSKEELLKIKALFSPLKAYCVYDVEMPEVKPLDFKETIKRRPGKFEK